MKKIIIGMIIFSLALIAGCSQQQAKLVEITAPAEQPASEGQKQVCTEMWICQNENTKAYRKADCSFEQITDCSAGCENGQCKAIEKPKEAKEELKETPKQESVNRTKEACAIGWKCLDAKRKGYQSSNCAFTQVNECKYDCKDGSCIATAPIEEKKEETFTLTEGKAKMPDIGYFYADFSKKQILQKEVDDRDVKVWLYSKSNDRNYFRVESSMSNLWVIQKGIKEASREDCMANIKDADAYGSLSSGQTVCMKTKEGNIALLGGYWEGLPNEQTELSWKYYY